MAEAENSFQDFLPDGVAAEHGLAGWNEVRLDAKHGCSSASRVLAYQPLCTKRLNFGPLAFGFGLPQRPLASTPSLVSFDRFPSSIHAFAEPGIEPVNTKSNEVDAAAFKQFSPAAGARQVFEFGAVAALQLIRTLPQHQHQHCPRHLSLLNCMLCCRSRGLANFIQFATCPMRVQQPAA